MNEIYRNNKTHNIVILKDEVVAKIGGIWTDAVYYRELEGTPEGHNSNIVILKDDFFKKFTEHPISEEEKCRLLKDKINAMISGPKLG